MWGSSQAQVYHMRWFEQTLPKDGSVVIKPYGMKLVGLSIAGPKARDLLSRVCDEDVSNEAFKFMDYREMVVANVPTMINRITYTGDLGYEIWVSPEYELCLYDALMEAGKDLGVILECAPCCACASRKTLAPGTASSAPFTVRLKRAWTVLSNLTRVTLSAEPLR
jgi:glycine cleavage system aminomethyltransferase T